MKSLWINPVLFGPISPVQINVPRDNEALFHA